MNILKNIMIVEDEIMTQSYLKDIINQMDIEVMGCFSNGVSVLEAINEEQPSMILMDINLEGAMDGIRLSKRILEKYEIPILFISATTMMRL